MPVSVKVSSWSVAIDASPLRSVWGYARMSTLASLSGRGLHQGLPALVETGSPYPQRIPTAKLNKGLRAAQNALPAPVVKKHRPRILYATQGATDAPTFTIFATRPPSQPFLRFPDRTFR